jgi:hypothetical protein
MARGIRLQNDLYVLDIDAATGGITRLTDRGGGGELIAEPRLAEGFRVLLPLPDTRCNYILGNEQARPKVKQTTDAVELHWRGPLRSAYGSYKLAVTLRISLSDKGVEFNCRVRNATRYDITEVWYGFINGTLGIGSPRERAETEALVPYGMGNWHRPIFKDFGNSRGQTLGVTSVEHGWSYPGYLSMPWISLYNKANNRAVYFAALEETPRVKVLRLGMEPGAAEKRVGGNWLRAGEVPGPRGLCMNWTHFPYTKPGETFVGCPFVLRCHAGGWRDSAKIYGDWFRARYPVADPAANFMRRDPAFGFTMFMLPEDNVNLRFTGIGAWAAEAKKRGINHVQIAGWQIGGHDRGYPYYTPDPKLGTWKELEQGIRDAHKLGVKVSFFINCQPVDASTEWYKRELHKYRFMDPYGVSPFIINYWGMGTLGARMKFNATPFVEMNPAHPEVRKLLIDQFRKLVEIGADGLHLDKFMNHAMDFNPRLKQTPDLAHHDGLLKFIDEFERACKTVNPDFAWSFEGNWDRMMSHTETCWWGPRDSPIKAVFPEMARTTGVEQPGDFNKVNLAVLQGDLLLMGPANYNRGLDWPPMQKLARYVRELNRVRREHWDILCAGEVVDASEGIFVLAKPTLRVGGAFAKSPDAQWRVFRNRATGKRGIVLVNLGAAPLSASGVSLTGGDAEQWLRCVPGQPDKAVRFPASVTVPSERSVFFVEV